MLHSLAPRQLLRQNWRSLAAGIFVFCAGGLRGQDLSDAPADPPQRNESVAESSSDDSSGDVAGLSPPFIVAHPSDHTVAEGARVTFWVSLDRPGANEVFQWLRDGVAIPGANDADFSIGAAVLADAGQYSCEVRNSFGVETSHAATLLVVPAAQGGRIVSLSVVTSLDSPQAETIVEFSTGGVGSVGTNPILIRAVGPSLARFGIATPNPAPRIELFADTTKIAVNERWLGLTSIVEAAARVGAFPLAAGDSMDAALLVDARANSDHRIRISGQGGATGVVLTEIYDATPSAAVRGTTPRLVKFSVLKEISPGANVSAGFVITGLTPKTVLIRVLGPALANLGINGAMSRPVLTLLQDATPVAVNDRWGDTVALRSANAAVSALPLEPSSADAALVVSLPHGRYAVQASGAGNQGGLALVEIFELP